MNLRVTCLQRWLLESSLRALYLALAFRLCLQVQKQQRQPLPKREKQKLNPQRQMLLLSPRLHLNPQTRVPALLRPMPQRFSQSLLSPNLVYSPLINHGDVPIQGATRRISKVMGSSIISKKGMFQIVLLIIKRLLTSSQSM